MILEDIKQSCRSPWVCQKAGPELNAIRHKHLHFSARYNGTLNGIGHFPRRTFFKNKRERYVFKG